MRSCLVDARRKLLFMVEQVFLPAGEDWSMHEADTQCLGGVGGRVKKSSYLNFYCLAIKYEFYLTNCGTQKCFVHSLQKRKFTGFKY